MVTVTKTPRLDNKFDRISTASSAKQFLSPRFGKAANTLAADNDDRVSVSAVSARNSIAGPIGDKKSRRVISIASSMTSSRQDIEEVFSHVGKSGKLEDDEWNAIVKFNTLLHYEEQKIAEDRREERKRLLKLELDRQMADKRIRQQRDREEG